MLKVAGDTTKLLAVTAACQGLEVKLETDIVNFGTVCGHVCVCCFVAIHDSMALTMRFPSHMCFAGYLVCRCAWALK